MLQDSNITIFEKQKKREAKKTIKLYKAYKLIEKRYYEQSKKMASTMVAGETLKTRFGEITFAEAKRFSVDRDILKEQLKNGNISKEEVAKWISEKYSLTKEGKDAFTDKEALANAITTAVSGRLYIKPNDR